MNPYFSLSTKHRNIVDLHANRKTKVTVTQCPLVTAMKLAQEHCINLQFCPKCVHATIGYTCCTVKYSHTKTKDDAALLAVQDCIDAFNKLTGKH